MTAPGTLMMAKIFVPETQVPETMGTVKLEVERTDVNVIDAAGRGASEGLVLALNVGAMLISFLALIALVNALLGLAGLSLPARYSAGCSRRLRGAWACRGGCAGDREPARHPHGANEFVAYAQLGPLKSRLDPRSFTLATFALCGFANFARSASRSAASARWRRRGAHDLARLGLRAMLAGRSRPSSPRRSRILAVDGARTRRTRCTKVGSRRCAPGARAAACRTSRSSSAPASAISPTAGERDRRSRTATSRTGRRQRSSGMPASSSSARCAGKRVAALSGRAHFYEGHDLRTVTFATRVLGLLGVKRLILTNAAGGINLSFKPGTLMVMDDHINLLGSNPLVGAERRALRPALPRHDRGLFEAAARHRRPGAARGERPRSRTASTSRCTARATRRPPRSASSGRSAPTPSACPPCPKRSSRGTWGWRCSASPASRIRRPVCCRSRSSRRSHGSGAPGAGRVLALLEGIIERL